MAVKKSIISVTDRSGETENGGGWYQTVNEFVADQQGDYSGGDTHDVVIYPEDYPSGLATFSVEGFTGFAQQYDNIVFRSAGGPSDKITMSLTGTSNNGKIYTRIVGTTLNDFITGQDGVSVGCIRFRYEGYCRAVRCNVTSNNYGCLWTKNGGNNHRIENCVLRATGSAAGNQNGAILFIEATGSLANVVGSTLIGTPNAAGTTVKLSAPNSPLAATNSVFVDYSNTPKYFETGTGNYDYCAFDGASIADINTSGGATVTNSVYGISLTDGVDFTAPSTHDYTPVAGGKLENAGLSSVPLNDPDYNGLTRGTPPEIGAYEIPGAAPGVTFDGPDIVDQAGTEGQLFSFDENGEGTVASRFTGATSYTYAPGSDQPAGITVNPVTGNLEGTPTESGVFNVMTIQGSD